MARHYIITIGRSFGSCGREIGEKLSKELGVSFYDRNLILMAAKKSGMKMELLESADEKLLNPVSGSVCIHEFHHGHHQ